VMLAPPPGPKAPSFFCSQASRASVQSASDSQRFSRQTPTRPQSPVTPQVRPSLAPPSHTPKRPVLSESRQKPQNTRCCVPDGAAVFEALPVVSRNGTDRLPTRTRVLTVQSWLVGYSGRPVPPPPSGMQGLPLSKPPLHLSVTGLQMGQGWMSGSLRHVPP